MWTELTERFSSANTPLTSRFRCSEYGIMKSVVQYCGLFVCCARSVNMISSSTVQLKTKVCTPNIKTKVYFVDKLVLQFSYNHD